MPTRREIIEQFIPNSPHSAQLGIRLASIGTDEAVLELPFKPELATIGQVVHGGAIGALIDTAAMAAAWATDDVPESPAGSTVSLSVNFATAELFSREGAKVLINDLDGDVAEEAAKQIEGETAVFAGDLTKPGTTDEMVKAA